MTAKKSSKSAVAVSRKPRKKAPILRRPKVKPVYRQFFIDDEGRNRVHTRSTEKTITLSLQLEAEGGKKRKIGVITKSTRTIEIKRSLELHLMRKFNAYGFNEHVLVNAKTFDTIRLSDEERMWKIPVKFIIDNGKHLIFKQQGYELQLFVTLEQLGQFRVYKKEGRRF